MMPFVNSAMAMLVAAAATAIAADDILKVVVTHDVQCDRRTVEGDTISVQYNGTIQQDGIMFDSSYRRNKPISFMIGGGQVIKGFEEGLLDMCIGEKRTLTVPPRLGYGNRGFGLIPANSTLIFKTELVGIEGLDIYETTSFDTSSWGNSVSSLDGTTSENSIPLSDSYSKSPTPLGLATSTHKYLSSLDSGSLAWIIALVIFSSPAYLMIYLASRRKRQQRDECCTCKDKYGD